MQRQRLADPLPRSIWKQIVQDNYVNFWKLFAAMEPGYDVNDDPKDFHGGYALVKKDQANAKKPVASEADWIRVYSAWEAGVLLAYPHRRAELQGYRRIVMELFRAVERNPAVAIDFDIDVRQRYSKEPYRMDSREHLQIPLFSQMFNSSNKRASSSQQPTSPTGAKRVDAPCINWNYGACEDPCNGRRKHGICTQCGGEHRARDVIACFTELQAFRTNGRAPGARLAPRGGGGGGARA
ncbi:hypothetical protein FIBSPDRAFT_810364 [Athelia psychrophila]|uniref:C3H1-type domain-containing protein n=1 Tax=Athelia psychrophila TaxID=1759441 RepID=A0A166WJN4_9AGAM|nr:hypothetical protein FIBSPDRAFT_810364 [Fibularhizoctonia sp. CBS 109695]